LLHGFRGAAGRYQGGVAVAAALGRLMRTRPDIVEIVNPLMVHDGQGATALDALIVTATRKPECPLI
jgi:hypothetical protein